MAVLIDYKIICKLAWLINWRSREQVIAGKAERFSCEGEEAAASDPKQRCL